MPGDVLIVMFDGFGNLHACVELDCRLDRLMTEEPPNNLVPTWVVFDPTSEMELSCSHHSPYFGCVRWGLSGVGAVGPQGDDRHLAPPRRIPNAWILASFRENSLRPIALHHSLLCELSRCFPYELRITRR